MFYSQFILAKKGPLGTIWIAAHLERKLRKNQVADTDIGVSVDSILFPEMPIALRLSSHLLLGVVRIYSRKVNYLFDDCSEALLKVKQAFRSTAVDLPPEESTAPYHSITLPETFDLDDFELPDSESLHGNYVDHHISSKEQITLQDTMDGVVFSTSKFGLDERFGDGDASGLDLDEELLVEKAANAEHTTGTSNSDYGVDPHASFQFKAPASSGVVNQQMEEDDGDNEPADYAQAPCTPGLWEEPNLSNIQETSACDDHQEPENHTITEFAVKNLENASTNEPHEHHNSFEHHEHHDSFEPHEHHNNSESHEHHNGFEPHEKSLPHIDATEKMLMDDLGSAPFTESVLADHVKSMSEAVVPVSKDSANVEDLDKHGRDGEPGVRTVYDNRENCVGHQGDQENLGYLTTELESNTEPILEPKDPIIFAQSTQESMSSASFPSLRPCVTLLNHEINGEGIHVTEAFHKKLPEAHLSETSLNDDVQLASNVSNRQVDNIIESEVQVDNINYTSDFPAPEKLLSLPQGFSDVPRNFVPETTPGEKCTETSGRKRSFAESSMTAQSLDLNQSAGFFTTNMMEQSRFTTNMTEPPLFTTNNTEQSFFTANRSDQSFFTTNRTDQSFFTTNRTEQSVLNDGDLLSSILVGRKSSILKMKPTPPVSTKRRRSAPKTPKTGMSKRKVLMDDYMVLHGDTIRQQLTNTEDIRRLRKKAPCTRSEISMLEKQFWEDEIFIEPIFTGVSFKLSSLHSQPYDLSKIVVSQSDASLEGGADPKSIPHNNENNIQLEVGTNNMGVSAGDNVSKEDAGEDKDGYEGQPPGFSLVAGEDKDVYEGQPPGFPLVTGGDKDVYEGRPPGFPLVTDSHTYDNNTTNLDYYQSRTPIHTSGDVAEPFNSEHDLMEQGTAMEIDPKSFSDVVMPIEAESLTHDNVVPTHNYDVSATPDVVENINQIDASQQTAEQGAHSNDNMGLHSANMNINSNIGSSVTSEARVDVASIGEISGEKHDDEIRRDEEEAVNEGAASNPNGESDAQKLVYHGIFGEDYVTAGAYDAEVNPVMVDAFVEERENSGHQVTFPTTEMNVEDNAENKRVDDEEYTHSVVEPDTDFLNFDDVDDDDAGGDYAPDVETTRVIDNTGWSSRTKAVAKYLQIMFDKEGERGRNMVCVNNLLVGKTRKEASRMFFETLVLKTKDYIHVEQPDPYENINVFPRAKLLKSDF
uniref:sister chromatid cohesion 1 protein 4 n=1 Tax=Erigeron canadensis TaxID=72917 RepID=UPI001CB8BEDF|nr:sister chromatid cohesion 1 protein 4 [Erigeron canadensis]